MHAADPCGPRRFRIDVGVFVTTLPGSRTDHSLADVTTILVELNDLKRITSASREGSIATRMFAEAWGALAAGQAPAELCWRFAGRALAAARLGDIDRAVLSECGLSPDEATATLTAAAEAAGGALFRRSEATLRRGLAAGDAPGSASLLPPFVGRLARQPRAGVTCPGRPRVLLEPPENHAEHCLMVAVYGVLLAPVYDADPGRVFLAALAHHFHNAGLPDSGFTGEVLLGRHLGAMIAHYADLCLDELDPPLRALAEDARSILPDDATADGRAFHAADVLDRVLQIRQYGRAAALTPERMLGEMELVHAGPVKAFQDDVLRRAGLL